MQTQPVLSRQSNTKQPYVSPKLTELVKKEVPPQALKAFAEQIAQRAAKK